VLHRHTIREIAPGSQYRRVMSLVLLFGAFLVALEIGGQLSLALFDLLCPVASFECYRSRPTLYAMFAVSGDHFALALVALSAIVHHRTHNPPLGGPGDVGKFQRGENACVEQHTAQCISSSTILRLVPALRVRSSTRLLFGLILCLAIAIVFILVEYQAGGLASSVTTTPLYFVDSVFGSRGFVVAGFTTFLLCGVLLGHLAYGSLAYRMQRRDSDSRGKYSRSVSVLRVLVGACTVFAITILAYAIYIAINLLWFRDSMAHFGPCANAAACNPMLRVVELCVRSTGWILACEYTRRWWSRTEDA